MIKPLLVVLAVGAAIGWMVPTGTPAPPDPVPAQPAPVAAVVSEPVRDTVLEKRGNGHFYVNAKVNGQLVEFIVDTGATAVALTMEDARRIGIPFDEGRFTVVGEGASGPVRGQAVTLGSVSVDGKSASEVRGAVLEGLSVSLLGQAYLSRIAGVEMSGDRMTLR